MDINKKLKKKQCWFFLVAFLLLTSCGESETANPTSLPTVVKPSSVPTLTSTPVFSLDVDAEYQIYNTFFNSRIFWYPLIIVVNETNYASQPGLNEIEYVRERFPTTGDEVWENFLSRNDRVYQLEERFAPDEARVMLVTRDYLKTFFDSEVDLDLAWQKFDKAHPDSYGYVTLSRVGVNAAMDEAIIYFERSCGGLCGSGSFALLTKYYGLWWVETWESLWYA